MTYMYISNYVAASNCSWAPLNRNGANAVIVAEIGLKYRLYASELLLAVDLEVRAHWWRLAPTDWLPTADSRASGSPRSLDPSIIQLYHHRSRYRSPTQYIFCNALTARGGLTAHFSLFVSRNAASWCQEALRLCQ